MLEAKFETLSWSSRKKREGIFCNVFFSKENFFTIVFYRYV